MIDFIQRGQFESSSSSFFARFFYQACFLLFFAVSASSQVEASDFEQEMRLAGNAEGRVSRVEHLKKALELRPDHPENIVIEYRIGVAIAQHSDPADIGVHDRSEAAVWFKGIVENYRHLDYYQDRASGRTWGADLLVPGAKVHLASLPDAMAPAPAQRREILISAMEDIESTYRKRLGRWLLAPEPKAGVMSPPRKLPSQRAIWKERVEAARAGDVLHDSELQLTNEMVLQYAFTYGRQKVWEVRPIMQELIDRFPDTPIEQIAKIQIARAEQTLRKFTNRPLEEAIKNLDSQIQDVDSTPINLLPVEPEIVRSEMARKREVAEASPLWAAWIGGGMVIGAAVAIGFYLRSRRSGQGGAKD